MPRKSRIRIKGNDRFLMMLCRDARRRWLQYGENRKIEKTPCIFCKSMVNLEVDHIDPLGPRPRKLTELPKYLNKMIYGECRWLCRECNQGRRRHGNKV